MEWQQRHTRRAEKHKNQTIRKIQAEKRRNPRPSDQRDEVIGKLVQRNDAYVARQRRKAKGRINRDGSIVASSKGDLGCVISALGAGLGLAATALRVKGWL